MIEITHLVKTYHNNNHSKKVFDNFSLTIQKGEILSLLGKSGSGKTTLGRILCGLDTSYSGTITIGGVPLATYLLQKRIALVSQSYSNFEWMSVLENVMLEKVQEEKALEILKKFGLGKYAHSFPKELSGGQQQRVAVARAIAQGSEIIVFDEACSGLDDETKMPLLEFLKTTLKELGVTTLFITHSKTDSCFLADKELVLH